MTIEIDQRTGLMKSPTASGMERIALCPGSWNLEKDQPETETSDSSFGTRVHASLAGEEIESVTKQEQDTIDQLSRRREAMFADLKIDSTWDISLECRLTINRGLQILLSGQYDGLAISPDGKTAVVWDYKSLPGEVAETRNNIQLRSLAVLVKANYPDVTKVIVNILQAFTKTRMPVVYDEADLVLAEQEIRASLQASQAEDAPINPGIKQCDYCRAKLICPAHQNTLDELSPTPALVADAAQPPSKGEVRETARTISAGNLVQFYKKAQIAKLLIEAIEEEAFRRLCEDPQSLPGLGIECDKPRISAAEELWKRAWLASEGLLLESGRAKKGALKLADAAWSGVSADLIRTTSYKLQMWNDTKKAAAVLQAGMDAVQYRKVAGKITIVPGA